jgi:hypothetical protein
MGHFHSQAKSKLLLLGKAFLLPNDQAARHALRLVPIGRAYVSESAPDHVFVLEEEV